MQITYRKVLPTECELYRAIRLESLKEYPNSYGSVYAEQMVKAKLGFESNIENQDRKQFIIGAFDGDKLIGICGFYGMDDERFKHQGELIQMYVKANYQGCQIGFNLLEATVKEAFLLEELKQIELGVFSSSPAALRIYQKAGFEEFGLQKDCLKTAEGFFHLHLMMKCRS